MTQQDKDRAAFEAAIELPPLAKPQVPRINADIDLMDIRRLAQWCERTAQNYARAAIEHDRQQRTIDGITYPPMDGLPCYLSHNEVKDLIAEAIYTERQQRGEPVGEVVVTKDDHGRIVAVTRQDREGMIMKVIAISEGPQPAEPVRGEPVGYIMPTALRQLKAGGNAIVGGASQGCDIPIFTAPQPAEPVLVISGDGKWQFSARFDTDQNAFVLDSPIQPAEPVVAKAPVKGPSDEGWPEALTEFNEGQWWVKELDAMKDLPGASPDQKRAVAVVHHMLASVARYGNAAQSAASVEPCGTCGGIGSVIVGIDGGSPKTKACPRCAAPVAAQPSDDIIRSFDEFSRKYTPKTHEEQKRLQDRFSEWVKFDDDVARYQGAQPSIAQPALQKAFDDGKFYGGLGALGAQPSAPDHLMERLLKHSEDKANTAFARSTMKEALQYMSSPPEADQAQQETT